MSNKHLEVDALSKFEVEGLLHLALPLKEWVRSFQLLDGASSFCVTTDQVFTYRDTTFKVTLYVGTSEIQLSWVYNEAERDVLCDLIKEFPDVRLAVDFPDMYSLDVLFECQPLLFDLIGVNVRRFRFRLNNRWPVLVYDIDKDKKLTVMLDFVRLDHKNLVCMIDWVKKKALEIHFECGSCLTRLENGQPFLKLRHQEYDPDDAINVVLKLNISFTLINTFSAHQSYFEKWMLAPFTELWSIHQSCIIPIYDPERFRKSLGASRMLDSIHKSSVLRYDEDIDKRDILEVLHLKKIMVAFLVRRPLTLKPDLVSVLRTFLY